MVLALSLAVGPSRGALAAASDWAPTDHSSVRLISAVDAVGRGQTLGLGLQFRMAPKWKTYWRSPGDAGYPPKLDWTGSENVADAAVSWPVPGRYAIFGLNTFIYEDEVVLPIEISAREAGKPVRLRLAVDYLLCDQICIPYAAKLALDLPAGPAAPSRFTKLIGRYAARVPGDGVGNGLAMEQVRLTGNEAAPVLEVLARSSRGAFAKPDILIEGPKQLQFGIPDVEISGAGMTALLRIPVTVSGETAVPPKSPRLTLTLVDGARAMEKTLTAVPGMEEAAPLSTLFTILALALLGGFILNLMPCVLPVLSIKLLGVIEHGDGERGRVRLGFLMTAAGILFSFLVLALTALGLRSAGGAIGWGIQFQQPAFLVAMSLLLTLFACNMWGIFEIRLPGWAYGLTTEGRESRSLGGAFGTGAFATLLATPCSAPFLGTAVGFALARGPFEIFAVFAALGIGLALPYLLVAAAPGLARHLPRPGPWIVVFRRILGFALAATVLWLVSVLAVQSGTIAALAVGALMAVTVLVIWRRARLPQASAGAGRAIAVAAVGVVAVLAFLAPVLLAPKGAETPVAGVVDGVWRPFDKVQILNHVGAGKTVFVDVTADWCLSCQVNKALVLDRGEVAARLKGDQVVAMRADWTRPSDEISAYLASFGRYGIPFNVVYGPGAPSGVVLSELLTANEVLEAFQRAGAGGGVKSSRR
jgi:suppressor for copper-sensitivity B